MSRVDRQRGEDREELLVEQIVEKDSIVGIEALPVREPNSGRGQIGHELIGECRVSPRDELPNPDADLVQPLADVFVLRVLRPQPRVELHPQAAHPHLEELVQIVAEDREKLRPLQDG